MIRVLLAFAGTLGVAAAQPADLILHNARILTVDARFTVAQAAAIRDGRFVAVGSNAGVLRQRGPNTRTVDLRGRTVLPGLYDSHVHAPGAGLSEYRQPLPKLDSFAAVQKYLRSQAAITPKGEWITVPRTFPTRLAEMRMPTREVLDVITDHPVMFDASYVVIANTKALRMSGIVRDTPNPPGGEIVRDASGEPNGILKNAQRLLKGLRAQKPFSDTEKLDALEGMLRRYIAAGLTSVIDRALLPDEIAMYRKLRTGGRLPLRVTMTWRPDASGPADDLLRQINTGPQPGGDEFLDLRIFKVTLDGGMTIGTAYQRAPYGAFGAQLYGKTDPDDRGQLFLTPDKLLSIFRAAYGRGWSLTAHSQGGGAVDVLLGAFESLDRVRPIRESRSHLMHASFQSETAIAKAKRLGVLADVQAAWLHFDGEALSKVFGTEGMRLFFPLRSYRDAGVTFAGGSDHMIGHDKDSATNPYNPFGGMWISITRKTARGIVLQPEQRISREDALRSYTINGAILAGKEKGTGSIELGKLADLVVIDRDYLKCPEEEIRQIQPVAVVIGGKTVFGKLE